MQLSYLSYLSIVCVLADGYCIVGMIDIFNAVSVLDVIL